MPKLRQVELREVVVETPRVTLDEDIRRARERLQMTQPELADLVGVSESTISNWERGKHIPKNRLGRLRQVLRMDDAPTPTSDHTNHDQPNGVLLRDATVREALEHVLRLYEDAVRGGIQPALSYQPGAPDPNLIPGPTSRTDRLNPAERPTAPNHDTRSS